MLGYEDRLEDCARKIREKISAAEKNAEEAQKWEDMARKLRARSDHDLDQGRQFEEEFSEISKKREKEHSKAKSQYWDAFRTDLSVKTKAPPVVPKIGVKKTPRKVETVRSPRTSRQDNEDPGRSRNDGDTQDGLAERPFPTASDKGKFPAAARRSSTTAHASAGLEKFRDPRDKLDCWKLLTIDQLVHPGYLKDPDGSEVISAADHLKRTFILDRDRWRPALRVDKIGEARIEELWDRMCELPHIHHDSVRRLLQALVEFGSQKRSHWDREFGGVYREASPRRKFQFQPGSGGRGEGEIRYEDEFPALSNRTVVSSHEIHTQGKWQGSDRRSTVTNKDKEDKQTRAAELETKEVSSVETSSASDRASVIIPVDVPDQPLSSTTARVLHAAAIEDNAVRDKEMEMKYRQLPTKNLWKIRPSLPLPESEDGRGFIEFMGSLDQALQDILSHDPRSSGNHMEWARGWQIPLKKCLWEAVNSKSPQSSALNSMLTSCMQQVDRALEAGRTGEEAYRLLVAELKRELDTRACGAALQRLLSFRVAENVTFADFLREFRILAQDASRDREFGADFTLTQTLLSNLMSQQFPTLYEIVFPKDPPSRRFLEEDEMWKTLDRLKRNLTRALPPREGSGATVDRSSVGTGWSRVSGSKANLGGRHSSAAWVPDSVMNIKKDPFAANFPSWPAAVETWNTVYNVKWSSDKDPPLLARFSDPTVRSATFRKFMGKCLNCLSDDGHSVKTCKKSFLNKSGLLNNKIAELPDAEKEVVWKRLRERIRLRANKPRNNSNSHSNRSEVQFVRQADSSNTSTSTGTPDP